MSQDTDLSYTRVAPPTPLKWGLLPKVLSTLVVFFAVASVVLYAVGRSYEQAFLSYFGLNHQWFTASQDTYIHQGFLVVSAQAILAFMKYWWVLAIFILATTFTLCLHDLFISWGKNINIFENWRRTHLRPLLSDQSTPWQRLKATMVMMATLLVGFLFLLLLLLTALTTPTRQGTQEGTQAAHNLIHSLSLDTRVGPARFVELHKEGKLLAKGYPIAYGEGRIALYDPKSQTVRTFHTNDVEVRRKLSLDRAPSAPPKP